MLEPMSKKSGSNGLLNSYILDQVSSHAPSTYSFLRMGSSESGEELLKLDFCWWEASLQDTSLVCNIWTDTDITYMNMMLPF